MPNLTTGFPKRTGNLESDYENLYNWSVSLIDELKAILCNLDSGNVSEAASVKAQNIDVTQAKIKDAQIKNLTADKLTAGTIDAKKISIKDTSGNGYMELFQQTLTFLENNKLRIYIGRDNKGNYIFLVQNSDASQGIYMKEDGNVITTGSFSTGMEGQARTVIDKNGIQSYDADGNRYGLWCNEPSSNDIRYTDFNLYYNGQSIFQVYNSISGVLLRTHGLDIFSSGNGTTVGKNTWKFEQGASGKFQTADGKIVTVSGGLITDIS